MKIEIHHETRYSYTVPATYSVQSLRLTPRSFIGQEVKSWTISVPGIEGTHTFRDGCGNAVCLITCAVPHNELVVTAQGQVETSNTNGIVKGLPEPSPPRVFLRSTIHTAADDAIRGLAAEAKGASSIDRLHNLMSLIHQRVAYRTGTTAAHTSAAEAFAAAQGVCQDHAHIFIAAARSLGIPARYVTGYLVTDENARAEAHHAWAEAYVENLGWLGFDVANQLCPTESYVRLAAGLDADHAAPIRGSRRGGGEESLDVGVQVTQQMSGQQ